MAKIKMEALLADFQRMRDEHWAYETNAEEEYAVDCSGAFVWAYRQHGKSIAHGSNRIARKHVRTLLPITAAEPGMAAFKALEPGEGGYDLPDAYLPGGQYYDGDLRDYYHIGLVGADGLTVLNAKGKAYGFVESSITDGWDYVAYLTDVEYEEEEPQPTADEYRVVGGRLNLRSKPQDHAPAVRSLQDGEIVQRLEDAGEWMKVRAGREVGYAQKQFLQPVERPSDGPVIEDEEYIKVPKSAWEGLKKAFDVFADASVAAGVLEDE